MYQDNNDKNNNNLRYGLLFIIVGLIYILSTYFNGGNQYSIYGSVFILVGCSFIGVFLNGRKKK